MNRILLPLLFFSFSLASFSQAITFSGSVIEEETLIVIPNAIVSVSGTALAQTTDEKGEFSFSEKIPSGDQIVSVTKEGYEANVFYIKVDDGRKVIANEIQISLTSKEKKRRKKLKKSIAKEEEKRIKERESKIKEAKKEMEKSEKQLAKEKKKLLKNNKGVVVVYDSAIVPEISNQEGLQRADQGQTDEFSPVQIKYADILGITPEEITNVPLYEFIDGWMGTPYLLGGTNKEGIDCSSFTQRLFNSVYDLYIERTAESQKASKYTETFADTSFLREGDLLFFGMEDRRLITHVGVYLGNNKFVNATSRKTNGKAGVKIDDLTDPYWMSIFCCAGKRIHNN